MSKRAGPLAGVRVLDFTRYLAGPFASMLLADYGADVVKLESKKGRERVFTDGSAAVSDSSYVHESILDPTAKVVEGFQPLMPSFEGKLSDPEIGAIVEYFRTLSGEEGGE